MVLIPYGSHAKKLKDQINKAVSMTLISSNLKHSSADIAPLQPMVHQEKQTVELCSLYSTDCSSPGSGDEINAPVPERTKKQPDAGLFPPIQMSQFDSKNDHFISLTPKMSSCH